MEIDAVLIKFPKSLTNSEESKDFDDKLEEYKDEIQFVPRVSCDVTDDDSDGTIPVPFGIDAVFKLDLKLLFCKCYFGLMKTISNLIFQPSWFQEVHMKMWLQYIA